MQFSEKLKQVRTALGLSQQQMAEKLGVCRAVINRLEGDRSQPNDETKRVIDNLYISMFVHYDANDSSVFSIVTTTNIQMDISNIVETSKNVATSYINVTLLRRNYLIGKRIDEEILTTRAEDYGKEIIKNLSAFLSEKYGAGFDDSNLYHCLNFARLFPNIFDSARRKSFLSWTHYRVLFTVDNDIARQYYEREALASGWSVKQLQRAIHSQYYERLLSTQGEEDIPLPTGEKRHPILLNILRILSSRSSWVCLTRTQ